MIQVFLPPKHSGHKWSTETDVDFDPGVVGHKAAGLSRLPPTWRPDLVVLSRPLLESIEFKPSAKTPSKRLLELSKAILNALPASSRLIVRSSVSNEWIDARGRYDSAVIERNKTSLARTLAKLYADALTVLQETSQIPTHGCALIVQQFLPAQALGHLVNEYRHAQRNVDFLYEADQSEPGVAIAPHTPVSFRLKRPVAVVRPRPLTLDRFGGKLDEALQHGAAWIARNLDRGHAEWVLSENRLWFVQFDQEQAPSKIRPLQAWTEDASARFERPLTVFRAIDLSATYDRWRKTRSHRVISQAGLKVPPIYVLDDPTLIGELLAGRMPPNVLEDLEQLVTLPTMLRLDVDRQHTDWSNLPAKGPVRSVDEAAEFLSYAVAQARERTVPAQDIALVLHHFLPASAAAWATSDPADDRVKIDSIWGLPDGLQAFPYDTTIVEIETGSVTPIERYKDEFLDIASTGEWVTRRTPPKLARETPLDSMAAQRVAAGTAAIARQRGKPTRVMWFLAMDLRAGLGAEVPWIFVDEDNDQTHWLGFAANDNSEQSTLAARLQRRIQLGNVRRLQNESDLIAFRRNPSLYDAGGNCVLFRPSADLIRRREFLQRVAGVVSNMPNWYLVLEGSLLAHAPYQLRSLGLRRVISVWEYTRPPKKTPVGKLVRDKIPEAIQQKGERTSAAVLPPRDLLLALRSKLVEEALEVFYAEDANATLEELADVLTVFRAIAEASGTSWVEIENAEREKSDRRGRFDRGLFLSATAPATLALSQSDRIELREAVRRLRYRTGMAISLIPPFRETMRKDRLRFMIRDRPLYVTVTYRGAEVIINLDDTPVVEASTQLDLF